MIPQRLFIVVLGSLCAISTAVAAEPAIKVGHHEAGGDFRFPGIPAPANNDAAAAARFVLVDGQRDANAGELDVLHDGRVPSSDDQPRQNFFFQAGTDGGRIRIDLDKVIAVQHFRSYSWHSGSRAPQVYTLYGADGTHPQFQPAPKKGTDPATVGWTRVAAVDTRPKTGEGGGQYGVLIAGTDGALGRFRHLLVDIRQTEDRDPFGNTFYSEFDVIDADGPAPTTAVAAPVLRTFQTADGQYKFTVDATAAPDLVGWVEGTLQPVVIAWYPKIVALMPSENFTPPSAVTLRFRTDMRNVPAAAGGAGVSLNAGWFQQQLKGEACGAVVHELVHVVQSYSGRRGDPRAKPTPGWIVEGIADYVRWFLYEPQSRGAEITARNFARAKYDGSYRISANFLDWVIRTHDKDLLKKLNAVARQGRYDEKLWVEWTGKPLAQLGDDWKAYHQKKLNLDKPAEGKAPEASTARGAIERGPWARGLARLVEPALAASVVLTAEREAAQAPIQVFILAGQSNMVGTGFVKADPKRNGGQGSLEYLAKAPAAAAPFKALRTPEGGWVVRDDVWIDFLGRRGQLTVGYGENPDRIGPELGFGQVVGDALAEPVLLIKLAWGGKSLAKDFRPPTSGGEVGPFYQEIVQRTRTILHHLDVQNPEWKGRPYRLAGFGWHQGWNDRINQAFNDEYEKNMVNFIRDIRRDLGVKDLPFVIAETGMTGPDETHPRALALMKAQVAAAAAPEFRGTVAFVGTRAFWRPADVSPTNQGYHWNTNAETYYRIGEAMGQAMLKLVPKTAGAR